jgi:hypothetical protein
MENAFFVLNQKLMDGSVVRSTDYTQNLLEIEWIGLLVSTTDTQFDIVQRMI